MTSLRDCLQEVIGQGPGYFIRTSIPVGVHGTTEWEPTALLTDMEGKSPGVLQDHAWTEWSIQPGGSRACAIHYGVVGASLAYQEVPAYGRLRALELSQRRQAGASGPAGALSRAIDV